VTDPLFPGLFHRRIDELRRRVDARVAAALDRAGDRFACRAGRTDCCRGVFPVSALDAWLLRRGLADLAAEDPERAAAIEARAVAAADLLRPALPSAVRATGRLAIDEETIERTCRLHAELPCPVLDPPSGRCELYDSRPMACRTFGPPLRSHGQDLPPCPYCFAPLSPAEEKALRVDPDPENLEEELLADLARHTGEHDDTFIPFALDPRLHGPLEQDGKEWES